MTLLIDTPTIASRRASQNIASNVRALCGSQPVLGDALDSIEPDVEWVLGRDASLTARDRAGRWVSGCSLPRRAAREMLKKLDVSGAVACFLAPTHAAQVAVALETMRPEQAVVALVPDLHDLALMLRCEDFAVHVASHRLWFVAGDSWAGQFASLYDEQTGLATPAQFIRVPVTSDEVIEPLVAEAQRTISEIAARRAAAAQALRARPWTKPPVARLCVVAPSRFRLWNDVGHALVCAAREGGFEWTHYDADDPARSSPLALAEAARACSAILTANTARCDLPGLLPAEMPWITWVTGPRIPSVTSAGVHDRLLVADPEAAHAARTNGWPSERVHVATWPPVATEPIFASGELAIVADTESLDAPPDLNGYSSHTLLWDAIRDELLAEPCAVGDDVPRYLASRMRKLDVADDGFPRATFVNRLILPAHQHGLARALIRSKVNLELWGEGWQRIDEFAAHARGPVESRGQLASILSSARALVHVWPVRHAHPVEFTGRPVLRARGTRAADFVAVARPTAPLLSGDLIRRISCGN